MNTDDLTTLLHRGFGKGASVRARRPGLYQVNLPAYLSDGDAATIFVESVAPDRVRVSDLGHTLMRISYTRKMSDSSIQALEHLARLHGFDLVDGSVVGEMRSDEVLAGVLGLIQIEAEAEASITSTVTRLKRAENFRKEVKHALAEAFGDACQLDYHGDDDPDGLFAVDALISSGTIPLYVAVTSYELDAERAVSSKLHITRAAKPGLVKADDRWIVVARDFNALNPRTRLRLMKEYLVPLPKYEEEPEQLGPKLRALTR